MNPPIPRFDHRAQYLELRNEVLAVFDEVLRGGSLVLGPAVAAFEEEVIRFFNPSSRAIGVGSGTDALAIALRALNISTDDEVITVANTAVATVSAIRMVGATPVFCDIDRETLQMNPSEARKKITTRTRAIIPVHLYGNAVDMPEICRIADLFGLSVIEDCAQSFGTLLHGKPTGLSGNIACFSFYPTKNLGAFGDAGMCLTQNRDLADVMRQLRVYGCGPEGSAEREGVNSRLDELQAAILRIKLQKLPGYLERRRQLAELYREHLPEKCRLPRCTAGAEHSYHLFVVRVQNRERVIDRLRAEGIECGVHYPTPIHLMPAYRFLRCPVGSLPHTELASAQILSLPLYPELSDDSVMKVCRAVERAIAE